MCFYAVLPLNNMVFYINPSIAACGLYFRSDVNVLDYREKQA